MLKQQARLFTKLTVAADSVCIAAALPLAYALIQNYDGRLSGFRGYSWVLFVIVPVWLLLIYRYGLYASLRINSFPRVISSLAKVHLFGGLITAALVYLVDPHRFSRLLLLTFLMLCLLLLTAVRGVVKLLLNYFRRKGFNVRYILIVGTGGRARNFVDLVRSHADWGLVVAGYVRFDSDDDHDGVPGCSCLGEISELDRICRCETIDEVVFALPVDQMATVDEYAKVLQEMGVTVRMVIDLIEAPTSRMELTMFHGGVPMLTFYGKEFEAGQLFMKRSLDIVGSLVGLWFTALIFPFVAAAIRMESSGPVFFGQLRVGQNGRTFRCWKFRSMYPDAELRKQDLLARNEMQGAMFKIREDPRVTMVGRFIRRTSLDELPQFWNVLRGEMSLVGTRPPTPEEVATYENWHRKRISIKPGMTGLWQVSGRNRIRNFDEVVCLDIKYIEEWTIWLDIKLLLKTFGAVLARNAS